MITSYRQARKVVILVLGSTVLLLGIGMIVLPGPTIIVIPLGLSILAVEFVWARRWLARIKTRIAEGQGMLRNTVGRDRQPTPKS